MSDWLFRVVCNLPKVLVPLGIKLGAKGSKLVLKSICLGTKAICLSPKSVRFAGVPQFKGSQNGQSDCGHGN